MNTVDDILTDGETLFEIWTPSFRQFIRRFVIVGLLTSILLGGATYSFGVIAWLATTALALLAYGFVFDDYAIWLNCRRDLWALTNRRLIYIEDAEYHTALSVPLTEIDTIKRSMWGNLLIRLTNRQKVTINFLANPKSAQSRIRDAATAATQPTDQP